MRTIMKTLFVIISAFSLVTASHAGEMTVTGSAKATYNITSGKSNVGKGIGVANELAFTATGEIDNGFTWKAQIELDPTSNTDSGMTDTDKISGAAINDDSRFELTMGDLGMVGIYVSEGGENNKYKASQDAVLVSTDTGTTPGIKYPTDLGAFNAVKYVSPTFDVYGASISASYGFGVDGGDLGEEGSSSNNPGSVNDTTAEQYGLYVSYGGLGASANYVEVDQANPNATQNQKNHGGGYSFTYDIGNFGLGYGKTYQNPAIAGFPGSTATAEYYETTMISVGAKVNDEFSVSYTTEKSEQNNATAGATVYDVEARTVQAAYNMGGLTIGLSQATFENAGYADVDDVNEFILSLSAAF